MNVNYLDFNFNFHLLLIEHILITTDFDMYIDIHIHIVISLYPCILYFKDFHVFVSVLMLHSLALRLFFISSK